MFERRAFDDHAIHPFGQRLSDTSLFGGGMVTLKNVTGPVNH